MSTEYPGRIQPSPTTQKMHGFTPRPLWKAFLVALIPISAAIALICGLYENPCPVRTGDRVTGGGGVGEVRLIYRAGAFTRQCKAGVRWDGGETEAVEGWRLEVVNGR